jgi:hypothetical protein
MLPIHLLGGRSFGQTLLTLVLTLVPALVAWWNDRRLLNKADDPALPELLANRRRLNVRTIAFGVALMIVFGGADAGWGIPVLIVLLIAVAYPLRTRVLGETWDSVRTCGTPPHRSSAGSASGSRSATRRSSRWIVEWSARSDRGSSR